MRVPITAVFLKSITYGELVDLQGEYRKNVQSLDVKGINMMKVSIKRGFSGLMPADSQYENAFVSQQKQNTKDFWMGYHDRMHELIYAELKCKSTNSPSSYEDLSQAASKQSDAIFMPTIFEINC